MSAACAAARGLGERVSNAPSNRPTPRYVPANDLRLVSDEGADAPLDIGEGFELLRRAHAPGWTGITIDEVATVKPGSLISESTHLIGITVAGSCALGLRADGRPFAGELSPGVSAIVPAGLLVEHSCEAPIRSALVWVPTTVTEQALQEMFSVPENVPELRPAFFIRDDFVERLCALMAEELQRPAHPAQALIFDGATHALAAHMLRAFGTIGDRRLRRAPNEMSKHSLRAVKQYMDDNLHEHVSLSDLAGVAGVSRFHFIRVFRLSTGKTPMAYLERSRIRRATTLLRERELTVSEIAHLVGFADQSHFSRRFKRHVGATPTAFRRAI
jgi:AraC family transcriptional regulator